MHPSAWAAVLRHIPAEQQHLFSVVTVGGAEISIALLLRIEDDFVIIKGRLSGSQDSGRVFFLPFINIDYFAYTNPVKDDDFGALFGTLVVPQGAPPMVEEPDPPARPSAAGLGPPSGQNGGSPRGSSLDRPSIRSEVLERFRSRPQP